MAPAAPRAALLLAGVCLFAFFAGLGRPAITDSDEGFYAEAAREMVESGDWLTPHFNYAHRFEKPVLYYWLAAAAYRAAGVGEAAARLPSALAGLGLVLLAFCAARRWFDEPTGLLAGLITATSFACAAMARQALPDLPLALFVALATLCAARACLDDGPAADGPDPSGAPDASARGRWLIAAAAAAGAGVLTKGPIGLALPVLVVAPLAAWEHATGRSRLRLRPGQCALAALAFLAVAAPWFTAMTAVHGPAYLDRFFIAENVERFATARYNDPRPWWYYAPIVAGGMLPWSPYMALWLPALRRFVRAAGPRRPDAATVRLAWWALAPLLFHSLSVGKQPRYVLPVTVPLAVLLAAAIRDRLTARAAAPRDPLLAACTAVAGATVVLLGVLTHRARPLLVDWDPPTVAAAAAAVTAAGLAVCLTAARPRWTPPALAAASIVVILTAHYVVLATPGPAPVERMTAMIASAATAGVDGEDVRHGRRAAFHRNLPFYTRRPAVDLPTLEAASDFLGGPTRVLCVLPETDADQLEADGAPLERLGRITYLDTGGLTLRTFLDPDPAWLHRVALVTNRSGAARGAGRTER